MAGALEGGGASASGGGGGAVWAVWAVRAAGVEHGLEAVKYCFPWQALEGGGGGKCERVGGEGGVGGQVRAVRGGGLGMDWEPVLEPLKQRFSWPGRGYRSSEGGAMGLH